MENDLKKVLDTQSEMNGYLIDSLKELKTMVEVIAKRVDDLESNVIPLVENATRR